jgi:hypothetical protein
MAILVGKGTTGLKLDMNWEAPKADQQGMRGVAWPKGRVEVEDGTKLRAKWSEASAQQGGAREAQSREHRVAADLDLEKGKLQIDWTRKLHRAAGELEQNRSITLSRNDSAKREPQARRAVDDFTPRRNPDTRAFAYASPGAPPGYVSGGMTSPVTDLLVRALAAPLPKEIKARIDTDSVRAILPERLARRVDAWSPELVAYLAALPTDVRGRLTFWLPRFEEWEDFKDSAGRLDWASYAGYLERHGLWSELDRALTPGLSAPPAHLPSHRSMAELYAALHARLPERARLLVSDYFGIPARLDGIELMAEGVGAEHFARSVLLLHPHFFGSVVANIEAQLRLGAAPEDVFVIGPRDSGDPLTEAVIGTLRVNFVPLDSEPLMGWEKPIDWARERFAQGGSEFAQLATKRPAEVLPAMQVAAARALQTGKNFVVLGDAGLMNRLLHDEILPKNPALRGGRTRLAEKTTRGITVAEAARATLAVPVFNAGTSLGKGFEAPIIGRSYLQSIAEILSETGRDTLDGLEIMLIGHGRNGRTFAELASQHGARVSVIDTDATAAALAKEAGHHVLAGVEAGATIDVLLASAGMRTVSGEVFDVLPARTLVVIGSTGEVELDATHVAHRLEQLDQPMPKTRSVERLWLGDRSVYLAYGGRTVNFAGAKERMRPEEAQLPQGLALGALIDAAAPTVPGPGVHEPNIDKQRQLVALCKEQWPTLPAVPITVTPRAKTERSADDGWFAFARLFAGIAGPTALAQEVLNSMPGRTADRFGDDSIIEFTRDDDGKTVLWDGVPIRLPGLVGEPRHVERLSTKGEYAYLVWAETDDGKQTAYVYRAAISSWDWQELLFQEPIDATQAMVLPEARMVAGFREPNTPMPRWGGIAEPAPLDMLEGKIPMDPTSMVTFLKKAAAGEWGAYSTGRIFKDGARLLEPHMIVRKPDGPGQNPLAVELREASTARHLIIESEGRQIRITSDRQSASPATLSVREKSGRFFGRCELRHGESALYLHLGVRELRVALPAGVNDVADVWPLEASSYLVVGRQPSGALTLFVVDFARDQVGAAASLPEGALFRQVGVIDGKVQARYRDAGLNDEPSGWKKLEVAWPAGRVSPAMGDLAKFFQALGARRG